MSNELPQFSELMPADDGFWGGGGRWEGQLGPWSTLVIDGKLFPGVPGATSYTDPRVCAVEIDGAIGFRTDQQLARGKDGRSQVVVGYKPANLTARCLFWRPEQWAAFVAYLPQLSPRSQAATLAALTTDSRATKKQKQPTTPKDRRAYSVRRTDLDAYGIKTVFIDEIVLPKDAEGRMIKEVRLMMREVYDLTPAKTRTASQTDSDSNAAGVNDAFRNTEGQTSFEERSPLLKHSGKKR